MNSVLGKLIQKEFGRNKYKMYRAKLGKKECMDVFCDIYSELIRTSDEKRSDKLLQLLKTIQLSVKISEVFWYVTVGYAIAMLILVCMPTWMVIKVASMGVLTIVYGYKLYEYVKNRFCTEDVRLVLIYKTALFHLLSDEGK